LPNVIMGSHEHGVPVVASDISGNGDLVVSGENRFFGPAGRSRRFCENSSNKLLDDENSPRGWARPAPGGSSLISAVEKMVARHAELYRELLG